jgi:hypothetical protein
MRRARDESMRRARDKTHGMNQQHVRVRDPEHSREESVRALVLRV